MSLSVDQPAWRSEGTNALDYLIQGTEDTEFPALSSTVSDINQIVASESESANKLTKAILQDFALTNKLLKLVNTVSYGQFGGKINTISKAVVILGFETVRNVAMTLILLEFLQNKPQAERIREEVIASFFAGLLASRLGNNRNVRDSEEAMICAMFQKLGKLLSRAYFFEESRQIDDLVAQGMEEAKASLQVLGISYDDLGLGIAKHWCFPDRLLYGMKKITKSGALAAPRGELDHLNQTVNLANELCAIAAESAPEEKERELKRLVQRYEGTGIAEQQLDHALEHGLEEISERSVILHLPTANSPLLKSIAQWSDGHEEDQELPDTDQTMEGIVQLDTAVDEPAEEEEEKIDPETVLAAGIQDVTNTLVGNYTLNDILQMVLETMYRAMGFNCIIAFVRDTKSDQVRARFGFGREIDRLLPKLHFPLKFAPDVFHIALEKGVDIVIENVDAENISSKIPAWYHDTVEAKCFLLLPIMINDKALGMLYADMQTPNSLQISPRQLGLLRTLRNQVVLAIKQKS